MTSAAVSLLLLMALQVTLAAPNAYYESYLVPEKRAALVLDRLLIALKHALREDQAVVGAARQQQVEEPRAVPLRYESVVETNDMTALQRRGQASPNRGRVLRCYFNAVTCF